VRFTQRPPMGDSKRKLAGGTTHLNYPYLASPFGRGVLRKQDGEGFLPLGEGGEAETLFRLDGWVTTQKHAECNLRF